MFNSALLGVQLPAAHPRFARRELSEAVVSTNPAENRLIESDQALADF